MSKNQKLWKDFLELINFLTESIKSLPIQSSGSPFTYWPVEAIARLADISRELGIQAPPIKIRDDNLYLHRPSGGIFPFPHRKYSIPQQNEHLSTRYRNVPISPETLQITIQSMHEWAVVARSQLLDGSKLSKSGKTPPSALRAYSSYESAIKAKPDLKEYKDVYKYLKENGDPYDPEYKLPTFSNWARYVRKGRKAQGQKPEKLQ